MKTVRCPKCLRIMDSSNQFCIFCGAQLHKKSPGKGILIACGLFLALCVLVGLNNDGTSSPSGGKTDIEMSDTQDNVTNGADETQTTNTAENGTAKVPDTHNQEDSDVTADPAEDRPTDSETAPVSWRDNLSVELVADIEAAFTEIGENPDCIESIEYDSMRETALFVRRDYKVTFMNPDVSKILNPDTWVHSRFYRITTEEWNEGEPERELFPYERLVAIKFWSDDNNTNINQWAENGTGKLQTETTSYADNNDINTANPKYTVTASSFASEIKADPESAAEKYNGQWIEITGTVTFFSDGGAMSGYYLYGQRSDNGVNIVCWTSDKSTVFVTVGDTVTFVGVVRDVTASGITEIGLCEMKLNNE